MLPSPPQASRNKQEYFPNSGLTPSLPLFPSISIIFSRQLRLFPLSTCKLLIMLGLLQHSLAYRRAVFLAVPEWQLVSPCAKNAPPVPRALLLLPLESEAKLPLAPAGAGARFAQRIHTLSPYAAFSPRSVFLSALSASSEKRS